MLPEHSKLSELFIAACDLPESELAGFLDEHCDGDSGLRQELLSMLQSDKRQSGIFADNKTAAGIQIQIDTAVDNELPEHIAKYRVKKLLGAGGMGIVYLAEQKNPRRQVAVKVIRTGLISQELLRRFELEASVLGRLRHPGIANIYEAGTFVDSGGQELPFIAMEYIDGIPLRKYVERTDPTPRERLRLFVKVCEAINHAHQRGVIHRDLKPGNVLVKSGGHPAIVDFGVARASTEKAGTFAEQTRTGQLVGTLPYMSPEQVAGDSADVDTRSDVYALGLIAYELLAGELPYDVRNTDYLKAAGAILEQQPASLATVRREFRGDLDTIVLKALAKEPDRRYQSARALAEDVERYLKGQPIEARRTRWIERSWLWCRRNRTVAALVASVAGLVLSIAVIASVAALQLGRATKQIQAENQISTRRLFDSYLDQVKLRRLSHRPGQRTEAIAALKKASRLYPTLDMSPEDRASHRVRLRSEMIESLSTMDLSESNSWPRPKGTDKVRFDATYERYAISDTEGNIQIRSVSENKLLYEFANPGGQAWLLRFSTHGNYFASIFHTKPNRCVRVWDTRTGRMILQKNGAKATHYALGDHTFAMNSDGNFQTYSLDTNGAKLGIVLETDFDPRFLSFGSDETRLAAATYNMDYRTQLELWDLETQESQRVDSGSAVFSFEQSPGKDMLAAGCADGSIRLFAGDDYGKPPAMLTGHTGQVVAVSFNNTGDFIASFAWDGTQRFWDVQGRKEILVNDEGIKHNTRSFGTENNSLGFLTKERFGIRELGVDKAVTYVPIGNVTEVKFHPTASAIALANDEGAQIWDLDLEEATTKRDIGYTVSVAFSPDGSKLYSSGEQGVIEWPIELSENRAKFQSNVSKVILTPEDVAADMKRLTGRNLDNTPLMEKITLDQTGRWLSVDCGHVLSVVKDLHGIEAMQPLVGTKTSRQYGLNYATISPDGKWVVTGTWLGNGVWVWNAKTGALETKLIEGIVNASVAFSPDGGSLAVATKEDLTIWEVDTWKVRKQFEREDQAWPGTVEFSPDGKYIISAYNRRTLQLRDLETGERLAFFRVRNLDNIYDARFSPDGNTLAAITRSAVVLWDLDAVRSRLRSMEIDW